MVLSRDNIEDVLAWMPSTCADRPVRERLARAG
jgi:hypothetical protein